MWSVKSSKHRTPMLRNGLISASRIRSGKSLTRDVFLQSSFRASCLQHIAAECRVVASGEAMVIIGFRVEGSKVQGRRCLSYEG